MAAQKTTAKEGVTYTVADAHGNQTSVKQGQPTFVGSQPTITIGSSSNTVALTKQNVTDLLPTLTAFSTSGVVS